MKARGSLVKERFILRYRGSGTPGPELGARLRRHPAVTVLDESPRMLLVEAPALVVDELAPEHPGWTVSRETTVPVPRARPRLRRPAS
jgi:hypothetical protein